MNRQQILHEQATLKQQYEKKEIAPREYVSEMTRLKSELSIVEKQICDDYDRIVLENNILKEKSLSAIELNEAMLPKSYVRISERFPHLNMKEIIEFDKKVRENGGSIKVHGGVYQCFKLHQTTIFDISFKEGWSCCISSFHNNGVNRKPCEICKIPVVFYLNPEDDLQNIKEIKVSDVSTAISSNITLFESAIQEYSIKIDKWKELQKTLDCLI